VLVLEVDREGNSLSSPNANPNLLHIDSSFSADIFLLPLMKTVYSSLSLAPGRLPLPLLGVAEISARPCRFSAIIVIRIYPLALTMILPLCMPVAIAEYEAGFGWGGAFAEYEAGFGWGGMFAKAPTDTPPVGGLGFGSLVSSVGAAMLRRLLDFFSVELVADFFLEKRARLSPLTRHSCS
jgi:hypothetical protein